MQQNDILYENETKKKRKKKKKKCQRGDIKWEVSAQNYRISNFLYKVVLDLTAAVSKNVTHHESNIMLLCWPSFAVKHAISWKSFER
jgi:hypothetical protein